MGGTGGPRCRPAVAYLGEDYPVSCVFTRVTAVFTSQDWPCRGRHDPRLDGKVFVFSDR